MKTFKTKLTGAARVRSMNRGRLASRNGWERVCPAPNSREGVAWLEGYDEEVANLSTLKHCTESTCGRMFSKGKKCPSCGSMNVRPNVKEGTAIIMTV